METRELLPELWEIILSHRFGSALLETRTVDKAFDGYALRALFQQTDEQSVRLQAKILSDPARIPSFAQLPDGAILQAMRHPQFDFADRVNALTAIAKRKNLEWVVEDQLVDVLNKWKIISDSFPKLPGALSPLFNEAQRYKLLANTMLAKEIYVALLPHLNETQLSAILDGKLEYLNNHTKDPITQAKILRELILFTPYFSTSQHNTMYDAVIKLFENKFNGAISSHFATVAALDALSALAPYLTDQQAKETIELAKAHLFYPGLIDALRLLISLWSHLDDAQKAFVMRELPQALSGNHTKRDVLQINLVIWFQLDAEQRTIFFNNFLGELKNILREDYYFATKTLLYMWPDLTDMQHKKSLETLLNNLNIRNEWHEPVLEMLSALWDRLKDDEKRQVLLFVKDNFCAISFRCQRQALESLPQLADNLSAEGYKNIAIKIDLDVYQGHTAFISDMRSNASIKALLALWRHFTDATRQTIFTEAKHTRGGLKFLLMLLIDNEYHVEASKFLQTTYDTDFIYFRSVLPILPLLWPQLSEHWRGQMLVMLQFLIEQPENFYSQPYKTLITLWPDLNTDQRVPFIELAKRNVKDDRWWIASFALNLLSYEAVSTRHPEHLQSDDQSVGSLLLNQLITWHIAIQETLAQKQRAGRPFPHFQFQATPAEAITTSPDELKAAPRLAS